MVSSVFWLFCIAFSIYGFFDVGLTHKDRISGGSRLYWLLVVLVPLVGGLAWIHSGRPKGFGVAPGSAHTPPTDDECRAVPPSPSQPPPRGPDDDAEFIKGLADRLRRNEH